MDFTKYQTIEEVYEDIKNIEIQGATNVALATFKGLKLYLSSQKDDSNFSNYLLFKNEVLNKANYLAEARKNEPLAKNGVKYLRTILKEREKDLIAQQFPQWKNAVNQSADEYLHIIENAKEKIIENSNSVFDEFEANKNAKVKGIFTHCHSSTAVSIIVNYIKKQVKQNEFRVVCTETRPRYQGRITAKNLLKHNINTSLVVDSGAEGIILDKSNSKIDIAFIGADQLTPEGDGINKIGSWGIALASYVDKDPIYIVTSLLKIDLNTHKEDVVIEMRNPDEVWDNAPKNLNVLNPAFEIIDKELLSGYITEAGVIRPKDLKKTTLEYYPWMKIS